MVYIYTILPQYSEIYTRRHINGKCDSNYSVYFGRKSENIIWLLCTKYLGNVSDLK